LSDLVPRFGGFEYGYQQSVLGQFLVMYRFKDNFPSVVDSSSATGWLTSVLQLGFIVGSILLVPLARFSVESILCSWLAAGSCLGAIFTLVLRTIILRYYTLRGSLLVSVLGRLVALGELNFIEHNRKWASLTDTFHERRPLYNAELASSELRGFLVSFYQVSNPSLVTSPTRADDFSAITARHYSVRNL
jgi:hypothetical protein